MQAEHAVTLAALVDMQAEPVGMQAERAVEHRQHAAVLAAAHAADSAAAVDTQVAAADTAAADTGKALQY
jgi:hypothetical protein